MPLLSCSVSPSSMPSICGGPDIRALVVVCRFLGDVLLATPLAQSLKQAGYAVDWLVAPGTEVMLEGQPFTDIVYTADSADSWLAQFQLGRRLLRKYDKAFVLTASDRPMVFALAASRRVYALVPPTHWQYAWKRYLAHHWLPYGGTMHMASQAIALAGIAGLPVCHHVRINWSAEDQMAVNACLPWKPSTPYVHIHPFARWSYKLWNTEGWRYLIRHLLEEGIKVALTGAPAEAEMARKLAERHAAHEVCVLAGKLNWRQLACLSTHARAYVGLDTANTHLAAGTGTPVIALFGPTDPRIWGPWPNGFEGETPWQAGSKNGIQRRVNISLLQGRKDCVPCQLEGCDRHQNSASACLREMQPAWVWQEIRYRLKCGPVDGQTSASNADA